MTLLNGLLAFGALAFTVPLAIHLLFRSRFTTLDWGAMHLLDSVIRINRRRLQLMNLLLLLLRCLLPILLAFCLARPVLTGFRSLPGDAPQTLIVALDDSQSMSTRNASGMTRIERAKSDLNELIGSLSRRDEIILVRSSRVALPAPRMGAQQALRHVRETTPDAGPLQLDQLVQAAVEACDDASHAQRRLLVMSDFQSQNVGDGVLESLGRVVASMGEESQRPVVSFLNYGGDAQSLTNVSVDSVAIESPAVVAGRGAKFSAQISNASDNTAQDLRLVWSIDGQPLPPRTITIPPRSSATNRLSHQMESPGVHQITLAVEYADALDADNRRSIGVDVMREINVMLVNGRPSNKPLEGETDFLAIALSPFAFGGEDQPDAVRTNVITQRRLGEELGKSRPEIIVLANVKSLEGNDAELISEFVLSGGSVVFFDGDAVDAESYNRGWKAQQGMVTLPATLGEIVGEVDPQKAVSKSVHELNPQYTPWSLLASPDQPPLAEVDVFRYRSLQLPAGATSSDVAETAPDDSPSDESGSESVINGPAVTLLSVDGGHPLVVSARRGRGQIIQFAIPCDAAWSTLPLRMSYLPMMQQVMLDLAGSRQQTTVHVGEALAVPVREFDSMFDSEETDIDSEARPTYTVQPAVGSEIAIEPSEPDSSQLLFADTYRRGTYRFHQSRKRKEGDPAIATTKRVVAVPPTESRLRDVEPSRLASVAETLDANVYTDLASLRSDERTRRFGREIWRALLFALLIAMIAELFLQQLSIRRTARGEGL